MLPFVTVWLDLESTTLRETSQTEEDKNCVIPLAYMWEVKPKARNEPIGRTNGPALGDADTGVGAVRGKQGQIHLRMDSILGGEHTMQYYTVYT